MNRLLLLVALGGVAAGAIGLAIFLGSGSDPETEQRAVATNVTSVEPKPEAASQAPSEAAAAAAASDPVRVPAPPINETGAATGEQEESLQMTENTTDKPLDEDAFRTQQHEGDVALGVCGARVSALLWFYESSVDQGREELQPAVENLTAARNVIKAEAERRATEDKVDTSVKVMNAESEKLWNELNEKAGGDPEDFQTAHDELKAGVEECLDLFFERPAASGAEPSDDN